MIYEIDEDDYLFIYNVEGNQIFGITKNNNWVKRDYNHHGNQIYREDSTGYKYRG